MRKNTISDLRFAPAASAIALGLAVGLAASAARAADDGEEPLWKGLGSVVGLTHSDNSDAIIEYRERSKLVIPPSKELPKPGVAAATNPAWPADQDIVRAKKAKALEDAPARAPVGKVLKPIVDSGQNVTVTMSATAGTGPDGAACVSNGVVVPCPGGGRAKAEKPSPTWNYNPLTWVGLQKKPETVLGPEPDRDLLTDPPPGYRAPVEGVGAKVEN